MEIAGAAEQVRACAGKACRGGIPPVIRCHTVRALRVRENPLLRVIVLLALSGVVTVCLLRFIRIGTRRDLALAVSVTAAAAMMFDWKQVALAVALGAAAVGAVLLAGLALGLAAYPFVTARATLHARRCERVVAAYNKVASQKVDGLAVAPVHFTELGKFSPPGDRCQQALDVEFGDVSLDQLRPLLDSPLYLVRGAETIEIWKRDGWSYVWCTTFDREHLRNRGKGGRGPDRNPHDGGRHVLWRAARGDLHSQKSLELRFRQGSYIRFAVWQASPRI